ncbi:MAG: GNAT family N-acetyltransferase [Lachnospiraceae bacterium]|nr:GNAT family N-acetyltransferase [Lachnospiraceae bacterium]
MLEIRYVQMKDQAFWYRFDKHLPKQEFENKVNNKRGYVLLDSHKPVGLLRYNLFWDNTPFCTMLFVDCSYRQKGYGRKLIEYWEVDMKSKGYGMLLTSTQVDEEAQHFYRKLGYKDCGGLMIDIPGYEQPMELFLSKRIEIIRDRKGNQL